MDMPSPVTAVGAEPRRTYSRIYRVVPGYPRPVSSARTFLCPSNSSDRILGLSYFSPLNPWDIVQSLELGQNLEAFIFMMLEGFRFVM